MNNDSSLNDVYCTARFIFEFVTKYSIFISKNDCFTSLPCTVADR